MGKVLLASHKHPKYPRLQIQERSNSKFLQAVIFLDGKMRMRSTKTTALPTAFKVAEDWYKKELRASVDTAKRHPLDRITSDPTIAELYASYYAELEARKRPYAKMKWQSVEDFWRPIVLSDVTTQTFKEFYRQRRQRDHIGNSTLKKDVVLIRQILKYALIDGLLKTLPVIPTTGTIDKNPRPWFTPTEWTRLRAKAIERVETTNHPITKEQRQDVLDMIDFLHASMMRVGELRSVRGGVVTGLRFRACRIEKNTDGDKMLLCEVTGKRGTRTCVARASAVEIYERRLKSAKPNDLMFRHSAHQAFQELLIDAEYQKNEQGFRRNLKSVRATSISHFLLENPDVNLVMVARNAGTSVAMIDEWYARRLGPEMNKNRLSELPKTAGSVLRDVVPGRKRYKKLGPEPATKSRRR